LGLAVVQRVRRLIGASIQRLESIVEVSALIADHPRAIDRYIDYFGETRPAAVVAPLR